MRPFLQGPTICEKHEDEKIGGEGEESDSGWRGRTGCVNEEVNDGRKTARWNKWWSWGGGRGGGGGGGGGDFHLIAVRHDEHACQSVMITNFCSPSLLVFLSSPFLCPPLPSFPFLLLRDTPPPSSLSLPPLLLFLLLTSAIAQSISPFSFID
eukprot:761023-Hanusia_phi.AAC.2